MPDPNMLMMKSCIRGEATNIGYECAFCLSPIGFSTVSMYVLLKIQNCLKLINQFIYKKTLKTSMTPPPQHIHDPHPPTNNNLNIKEGI